jgi:hypothetical protein
MKACKACDWLVPCCTADVGSFKTQQGHSLKASLSRSKAFALLFLPEAPAPLEHKHAFKMSLAFDEYGRPFIIIRVRSQAASPDVQT